MSKLWGTLLPYVGILITPCDEDGVPAGEENIEAVQFETRSVVFAWFGLFISFGFGAVEPRKIDPSNPRAFARGDIF